MPYINLYDRHRYHDVLTALESTHIETQGDLNFLLTSVVLEYLSCHKLSYDTLANCVTALENAKLEFYRRMVAPYEDKKIKQNGDVYPKKRK